MTVRRLAASLVACLPILTSTAWAIDKETKKWFEDAAPLMLFDEHKIWDALKDKNDQLEFEKIFWARRNPDLTDTANAFKADYEKAKDKADARIRVAAGPGSMADCGKAIIFWGEPASTKPQSLADGSTALDNLIQGGRNPEIWVFKGELVPGGEMKIYFDSGCNAPMNFKQLLERIASQRIVNPNIDYRFTPGKEPHLVKLQDLLPKPTPAQNLLKEPRQDFPLTAQVTFMKAQGGGTAVLGLVRGEGAEIPADVSAKNPYKVVICAQAENAQGKAAASAEQEANVDVKGGAFLGSFRVVLKPGNYTLKAGALDQKSGKGSALTLPVEVPDFDNGDLTASIMMLKDAQDKADTSAPDPQDAYAAFSFGPVKFTPYYGTTVPNGEPIYFFYQYYDATTDEQTHKKASVTVKASVARRTATIANSPEQTFETPFGGTVIGPVDLKSFRPGPGYKFRIAVIDNLANKTIEREVPFEIAK